MTPITISIAETCRVIGLKRTSVYELLNSGQIESVKLGRRRLVSVASLQALIEEAAK